MKMQYNVCEICGACDGRAGMLLGNPEKGVPFACKNCDDTRTTGNIVIHANLSRTEQEIQRTMDIIEKGGGNG